MDNNLICTVNKNLEMAMAKYSSITGQLAEMRKKILGPEKETNQSENKEETKDCIREDRAEFVRSSEESNDWESISGGNSSSLGRPSEESVGRKILNNILPVQSEEIRDSSIKETETRIEEKNNIFHELLNNIEQRSDNLKGNRYLESSSDEDENENSIHSLSENDKTIELLFMEEINKNNKNDISIQEVLIDKSETKNNYIQEEKIPCERKSDHSPCNPNSSNAKISLENIFKILESDGGNEKNQTKKVAPEINGNISNNDETVNHKDHRSLNTNISQYKKKNSIYSRKESYESNINSIFSDIKSVLTEGRKKKRIKKISKSSKKSTLPSSATSKKAESLGNVITKAPKSKNDKTELKKTGSLKKMNPQIKDFVKNLSSKNIILAEKASENIKNKGIQFKRNNTSISLRSQGGKGVNKSAGIDKIQGSKVDIGKKPTHVQDRSKVPFKEGGKKTKNQEFSKVTLKQLITPPLIHTIRSHSANANYEKAIEGSESYMKYCEQNSRPSQLTASNPREILSKIEEQIRASKLKEGPIGKKESNTINEANELISKKLLVKEPEKENKAITKVNTKPTITENNKSVINKGLNKSNHSSDSKIKIIKENIKVTFSKENNKVTMATKTFNERSIPNKNVKDKRCDRKFISNENTLKECEIKDTENRIRPLIRKANVKTNLSKNDLHNGETNQITYKKGFSNPSICEIPNEITMNIEDRRSVHFPFILGRSASKSFNIQANIQKITSLVRMLPKESIQRTLMGELYEGTRVTLKQTDKVESRCPACVVKSFLPEGSEYNLAEDPWDNTNKNFVRCTCLSKNTISSKQVLQQLLLQSSSGRLLGLSLENSSTMIEEPSGRNISSYDQSNIFLAKRNDLTKLLHVTQKFVTSL